MLLLTRSAREQARQRTIADAYARAWRFDEEETPGITLVNTLAFASLYARGTLHLTLMSALVLILAAAAQADPHANSLGRLLAQLLLVSSVVVPLVAGFRTAREVDKQAFFPPEE
jgi:hypothetical protein